MEPPSALEDVMTQVAGKRPKGVLEGRISEISLFSTLVFAYHIQPHAWESCHDREWDKHHMEPIVNSLSRTEKNNKETERKIIKKKKIDR